MGNECFVLLNHFSTFYLDYEGVHYSITWCKPVYEIFLQKEKQTDVAGGSWLALNRELKQHRRRRLRKRLLKSELALLQTLSRLFHRVKFVTCWQFFLELNSKRLHQSTGKEKESRCLVFTFSTFSRRSRAVTAKKCTKKRDSRAKLLFCFFAVLLTVAVDVAPQNLGRSGNIKIPDEK